MCRNIKTLYNFEPSATQSEIRAASLQFVRKISGFNQPSRANEPAFRTAIDEISGSVEELLQILVTSAIAKNRDEELAKARSRSQKRFGYGSRVSD